MIPKPAILFAVAVALAAPSLAQERDQAKPAESKTGPQEVQPEKRPLVVQAINVRVDVTITDQTSGDQPAVKTLTLLAADGSWTRVRSEGVAWTTGGQYPISLRVDARPRLVPPTNDKIHLEMTLEYKPTAPEPKPGASTTTLSESCEIVLDNGKPLVISQAADPNSDRKVKLEVKGTILR